MQNAQYVHVAWMICAIGLEVAANVFIKLSDGFRRLAVGFAGIGCILLSVAALSQAIRGIDLSVAYALWGGAGIVLTALAAFALFNQKLTGGGWIGIGLVAAGIALLRLA
ncbi:MAG: multidrug/spermidine efflux SMR transporter subunit MdtI [Proteobacteria bacterium]|nr:multidrug/spermidine efflux SMR transporter subunit MdtI [Pseudomonadota bacterium]